MKIDFCYNKNSIFTVTLLAGLLLSAVFVMSAVAVVSNPTSSAEQINAALQDLSSATSQNVTTNEQAAQICDSEKYFTVCASIGKKHDLYNPEDLKQVDFLVSEIKGNIAIKLQSCQTTECLISVAQDLANKVSAKDPKIASNLDLTPKLVEKKQAVIAAAKEIGVNYEQCRTMDPDTAPIELLRNCAKLAKDSRVKDIIPEDARKSAEAYGDYSDKMLDLKSALTSGQYQCGDNTLEGCGNFCLKPAESAKAQGASAIPEVCSQIAKKFFGSDGEKQLQSAYDHVQQTQDFYSKKAENVVFTTIDGKTITNLDDIGNYMEQQGKQGNVEAVEKGMDFMIAKGFIKPEEKDYVLKFVKQARDTGGQVNFDQCAQNPQSCKEFVPQDQRGAFDASIKLHDTIQQELGFDPRECAKAVSDQALGQKCLEASKKVLPQIQALGSQTSSPDTQRFIRELQQNISRTDDFYSRQGNLNQTYQSQQGGPGGCKSAQECFAYCSDANHGPECISFGAKQGIFKGQEAVQRFQQFNQNLQTPQQNEQGPSNQKGQQSGYQPFGQGGNFPGQGAFPGFQPPGQGGYPPGQIPGFPGSQGQGGFGGYPDAGQYGGQGQYVNFGSNAGQPGPSPECFAAIQSGDFVKAKELCTVNVLHPQPIIEPSFVGPPVTVTPEHIPYCPPPSHWDPDARQCLSGEFSPHPSPGGSYSPSPYPSGSPTGNPELDCKNYGGTWDVVAKYCKFPVPSYSPSPVSGSCSQPLINLLGSGCHWMYSDSTGRAVYCDGPMSKSAKEGDAVANPGCYSGTGTSPYPSPSGSCPSAYSHDMGSYCMLNSDSTKCASYTDASNQNNFGSCASFQGPYPTYTPYPSGTPYPTCPSGQWWDQTTQSCKSTIYTPYPSPSGSYTPYPSPVSGSCSQPLINLLGSGCHWMYSDSTGRAVYCDGPMSKSAKEGDAVANPGCYSGTGTSPYPSPTTSTPTTSSGSCPSGSHTMYVNSAGGYCMSDADATKCGPLNSTSVSSFGSCSSYQSTPTYTPYPSPSGAYTPYPSPNYSAAPSYVPPPSSTPPPAYPSYTPPPQPSYTPAPSYSSPPPYSPPPASSYSPPPPPTGFNNSMVHKKALANSIMICADNGGKWDSDSISCKPTLKSYFSNILKLFFR